MRSRRCRARASITSGTTRRARRTATCADCPQGLHAFLRAYYHVKSADWKENQPYELSSWSAGELAKMPTYYIMDLGENMAQTVAPHMPVAPAPGCPDDELRVYSAEYARTGFQGGLQWYRCGTSGRFNDDLAIHAGRAIEVPACFIAGKSDWGPYQRPGALATMQRSAFAHNRGCHFVEGAGHWVQQEATGRGGAPAARIPASRLTHAAIPAAKSVGQWQQTARNFARGRWSNPCQSTRRTAMNKRLKSITAFVTPALLAIALAGCAGTPHQESTGELIDDTVITTKVKAELLNDTNVSAMDIKVETFKGRVQLAGYVKSPQERQRAEGIARAVSGVKAVNNRIELK